MPVFFLKRPIIKRLIIGCFVFSCYNPFGFHFGKQDAFMKIIKSSCELLSSISYAEALRLIELATRVCYKSEAKIGEGTAEPLIRKIIQNNHLSPLEHVQLTFRLITSRAILAELTRHRICSFSVESTRYCSYGDKDIEFIQPVWVSDSVLDLVQKQLVSFRHNDYDFHMSPESEFWKEFKWLRSLEDVEMAYKDLLIKGLAPQNARGVLPQDLKTEIIMSCNLWELRHIFSLRVLGTSGTPHPDMKALLEPMFWQLKEQFPVFFEDLNNENVPL